MIARAASPRAAPFGRRLLLLALLALFGLLAALHLRLSPQDLIPSRAGLDLALRFFARAWRPALTSEAHFVPEGTPPLLIIGARAAWSTLVFAAAAMGLALPLGLLLGFFASTAWWADRAPVTGGGMSRRWRQVGLPLLYLATRALIAFLRSIHEILWAVLLLAAMGVSELACVLAIALPYAGTLAKIFAELIDEAPRDAALALRLAGATDLQVYFIALVPRAAADLITYSFYRFECALRSAAVLGFFGFPTLGLEIRQSFRSGNYGEVWTFLYLLIAMVATFDLWSGAIRRRLTR